MPCDVKGNMIICSRTKVKRCAYCDRPPERLCDYRLANGKTCDTPMCAGHSQAD